MKANRYPKGYAPKIEYWENQRQLAIEGMIEAYDAMDDLQYTYWSTKKQVAEEKIVYFTNRQKEVYGAA